MEKKVVPNSTKRRRKTRKGRVQTSRQDAIQAVFQMVRNLLKQVFHWCWTMPEMLITLNIMARCAYKHECVGSE